MEEKGEEVMSIFDSILRKDILAAIYKGCEDILLTIKEYQNQKLYKFITYSI